MTLVIRQEQKAIMNESEVARFLHWRGASRQHDERVVNSIYFDDAGFNSYHDSEEGSVTRHKYRFRWYGDPNRPCEKGALEIKSTFAHHKEKTSKEIDDFVVMAQAPYKWFEADGLRPVCVVSYKRKYFSNHSGERFTFDFDIRCSSVNRPNWFKMRENVLELKYEGLNNGYYASILGERLSRYSKYAEAMNIIYNLQ